MKAPVVVENAGESHSHSRDKVKGSPTVREIPIFVQRDEEKQQQQEEKEEKPAAKKSVQIPILRVDGPAEEGGSRSDCEVRVQTKRGLISSRRARRRKGRLKK